MGKPPRSMDQIREWPISKCKYDKVLKAWVWSFVKETKETSYEDALEQAFKLQKNSKTYLYRVWDCR